jgi:glycosyltransferase involved in cell wall biosynthesis
MPGPVEFSAIIPTYNRAHLVGRAIASALAQTIAPAEIIVVDDGSTDATEAACTRFGDRVRYVKQPNGGAARARNTGIQQARHAWIAFLDSDDVWAPTHLERMQAAINGTLGAAGFYFADMQMTASDGGQTLWQNCGFQITAPFTLTADATEWMLMKRQPAMLQSSVFQAVRLRAVGGFDERFRISEDVELFCRLGIGGVVCAVSGVGCLQTEDDAVHNRLTNMVSERSESYWRQQTLLWREVLRRSPALAPHWLRVVRWNLAESHVCLARWLWRSGRVGPVVGQLIGAAVADPALIAWLLRKRTSKGYEEIVRRKLMAGPARVPAR